MSGHATLTPGDDQPGGRADLAEVPARLRHHRLRAAAPFAQAASKEPEAE
jgi:hypothetical protein